MASRRPQRLLKQIGPVRADAAKDLAYCLYDVCTNKRRDAAEAVSYNGLIAVWAELTRQAAAIHDVRGDQQQVSRPVIVGSRS